jgi:hypothetical protein
MVRERPGPHGVPIFAAYVVGRAWERRAARRLRFLAASLPSSTPMWMTLFTRTVEWSDETSYEVHTVRFPWAALWPAEPSLGIRTAPSDGRHEQALCVKLVSRHEAQCPAAGWSDPEPVTVHGNAIPGEWIVIQTPRGAFWPTRSVTSSAAWRRAYKKTYKKRYETTWLQRKQMQRRGREKS